VLGNDCVAFDEASSSTHLIQQPAGLLLEWVIGEQMTLLQLSDRLQEIVTYEHRDDVFPYVVNVVQRYVSMGLMEIEEAVA
jgi:hypothetical protein